MPEMIVNQTLTIVRMIEMLTLHELIPAMLTPEVIQNWLKRIHKLPKIRARQWQQKQSRLTKRSL